MSKLPCLRRSLFLGTRPLSSTIFLYFHTCTYFCSRCCRKLWTNCGILSRHSNRYHVQQRFLREKHLRKDALELFYPRFILCNSGFFSEWTDQVEALSLFEWISKRMFGVSSCKSPYKWACWVLSVEERMWNLVLGFIWLREKNHYAREPMVGSNSVVERGFQCWHLNWPSPFSATLLYTRGLKLSTEAIIVRDREKENWKQVAFMVGSGVG